MDNNLKLYVWEDVFSDYTSGAMMVAFANNIKEARKMLLEKIGKTWEEDLKKKPKIYKKPFAIATWEGR